MSDVVSKQSPFYPYEKVNTGYNTMRGYEEIPLKILRYLMDLPLPGYTPPDNNEYPRCRLMKFIANDSMEPLSGEMLTAQEKLNLLYNPEEPDSDRYRIYTQHTFGQSQLLAKTLIKCYTGRTVAYSPYEQRIALVFEIWTNVNFESNIRVGGRSRLTNIEQALVESLNGLNIGGVGVISYNRADHPDCGTYMLYDEYTNVGKRVTFALDWKETTNSEPTQLF